ncbi:MAG TPA: outer membrane beta-barrel protein [Gemmatimonadaceae bacterium]
MTLLPAGSAWAGKYPNDHHGFFIGFNLGAGTADINTDGADTDREWGGCANFRAGGAISNQLLLGGEFTGWARDDDGNTTSLSTFLFAATYYPGPSGFFLRGGVGFGTSSFEADAGDGFTLSKDETGFALAAAAGYEWRLTKKFALGPQVEFNYLNIGGDLVDTANFFDATLGFNWYW